MRTHFKPTETFQYTFFTACHPPGAKKGFVKGEALRLLRTNSSNKAFEEDITVFKKHLMERGYPQNFINNTLSEVKFQERTQALLPGEGTPLCDLNGDVRPDRVWFSGCFVLNGVFISPLSVLNRVSLHDLLA